MKRALVLSIVISILMALVSAFTIDGALADTNLRIVLPGGTAYAFQESPRWVVVPGTRIYTLDGEVRPDFDVFRHGSYYYIYRGGNWYRARTWNGRYTVVADRYVPVQFNTLPRERWISYPPGWERRAMAKQKKNNNGKDRF